MEKLEYLALMLNKRTSGKKYENFVINSIYAKLNNPELIPVTQQYVKNINHSKENQKNYYLLDLYFPQINYGIEVDEPQHEQGENKKSDEIRSEDVLSAIQCEEGRIKIANEDGALKKYEDIEKQIEEQVAEINKRIHAKEVKEGKIHWTDNEERKELVKRAGVFDINDNVDYKGVTEIYNILGHNVKNLGRCFVKLNNKYALWCPYLAIKLRDGTIKTKNGWENTLNEEKTVISEIVGDMEECDTKNLSGDDLRIWNENGYKRIVFMHIKDEFGKDCVKFLGVYRANGIELDGNTQKRLYVREETKFDFKSLWDIKN